MAPVSDDGRAVVSASWDGTLRLWDTREGAWLRSGDTSVVLQAKPDDGWVETVTVVRRRAAQLCCVCSQVTPLGRLC